MMSEAEVTDLLSGTIVIVGAPRSGTSMLGRILARHPELVHIKEPRLIWRYRNDARSDLLRAEHATPEVVRYIRQRFAEMVKTGDGSRLLEKTPSNSLRLPFVEKVLPEAKFVHIIRNGFDSSLSIRSYWETFRSGLSQGRQESRETILQQRLKEVAPSQVPFYALEFLMRILPLRSKTVSPLWGPRFPGLRGMYRELELLEVAANQWRTCVELACQQGRSLGSHRYMEVRLEYLDAQSVEEILKFLELGPHEAIDAYMATDFDGSMSKRRRCESNKRELETLRQWIEPTMGWLGYSMNDWV